MINFVAAILLAAATLAESPDLVGYMPVTIRPGTNVVENLPATSRYQPHLKELMAACAGDIVVWGGESHAFDGRVWHGKNGGEAQIPIPAKFTVIRTALVTNVWNISCEIDMTKAPLQEKQAAR